MKRVICLYRVSTVGQVDHDDIPMQKTACREFVAQHPDWEIVDELSEKGVSGYKVSSNDRDAIMKLKCKALAHQFDILLVFMFDRLGRRDDETPFVVQWFAEQGIEVWSAREGEQRFDSHVDKLMNYIRFWQASGESEKTSMRVYTKHSQMVHDGQYRGGLVPYGYRLEFQGRTNKKNQPVRDLVIDEAESEVIRQIFHLIADEGYGANRVANWLNDQGIKTKKDRGFWRGTAIRAIVQNPIYIGVIRFGDERSEPFEHLKIIDETLYTRCLATIHARAHKADDKRTIPLRTDSQSLLTGLIFCAHCGSRLTFGHSCTKRYLADGTLRLYERDWYRCYRKIDAKRSCDGQNIYNCEPINNAVLSEVSHFFSAIKSIPTKELLQRASKRQQSVAELAYQQAVDDYEEAVKQIAALEAEAMKALTGESSLDLSIINNMMPKYRKKAESAQKAMENAKQRMNDEAATAKDSIQQTEMLLSWADAFDEADVATKHMILGRLIERIEVGKGYKIHIQFRISLEQFMGEAA